MCRSLGSVSSWSIDSAMQRSKSWLARSVWSGFIWWRLLQYNLVPTRQSIYFVMYGLIWFHRCKMHLASEIPLLHYSSRYCEPSLPMQKCELNGHWQEIWRVKLFTYHHAPHHSHISDGWIRYALGESSSPCPRSTIKTITSFHSLEQSIEPNQFAVNPPSLRCSCTAMDKPTSLILTSFLYQEDSAHKKTSENQADAPAFLGLDPHNSERIFV